VAVQVDGFKSDWGFGFGKGAVSSGYVGGIARVCMGWGAVGGYIWRSDFLRGEMMVVGMWW
jgi:hypothetical protein